MDLRQGTGFTRFKGRDLEKCCEGQDLRDLRDEIYKTMDLVQGTKFEGIWFKGRTLTFKADITHQDLRDEI